MKTLVINLNQGDRFTFEGAVYEVVEDTNYLDDFDYGDEENEGEENPCGFWCQKEGADEATLFDWDLEVEKV